MVTVAVMEGLCPNDRRMLRGVNCGLARPMSMLEYAGATGDVAQLGEHRLCKPRVEGSSPFVSTREETQVRG